MDNNELMSKIQKVADESVAEHHFIRPAELTLIHIEDKEDGGKDVYCLGSDMPHLVFRIFHVDKDGNINEERDIKETARLTAHYNREVKPTLKLVPPAVEENGEYETEVEKGGEVALEQFHITRLIHPAVNVRAGHLIVPVGLTNEQHEPINFFGTSRPEGETTILPSTWHETGIELFGTFGKGYTRFNYQAMVVTGLNANGFDRDTWVASGKQGIFEKDNFTSPGYVARLNYLGVPGLKVGGSFYFCNNTAANSDKHTEYNSIGKVPLRIYTADVQYKNKYVTARGNIVYGNLGNSKQLSDVNRRLSGLSPYSRLTPIAKHAVSYGGEVGFNLRAICKDNPKVPVIYPFVRYEYYNPQEEGESGQVMDLRDKVGMWTAGANWYALPNLVVKADYTTRRIGNGNYNSENEFSLAIAYIGWFWSK